MKLVLVHYHLRPGGIRRVIELATPHVVNGLAGLEGQVSSVVVATGEKPEPVWAGTFARALGAIPVEFFVEPSFGYHSELNEQSPTDLRSRVRSGVERLLRSCQGEPAVVWMQNPGLARNLVLTDELARACAERSLPFVAHHHDWWFDNRWQRWPEMRRAGFRTVNQAAAAVFGAETTRHAAINSEDAAVLRKHFLQGAAWLPNPVERTPEPPRRRVQAARRWLDERLDGSGAPVWILPCRFLRRKNVGEAILLTRWLRPEAWLVSTGDVSSADEARYYKRIALAARSHGWRVRLRVLAGNEPGQPSISELLAASEAVLLTSLQEGFGLPYVEAAAAARPLVARRLPNIDPDLAQFGFRFPQAYDEIRVAPSLFDWGAECLRQRTLFRAWKQHLPRSCRALAALSPQWRATGEPHPVPFSRLSLTAQLEVLAHPSSRSWEACLPLNPFLGRWRRLAASHSLRITAWPRRASRWLGGQAYAEKFRALLEGAAGGKRDAREPLRVQREFIASRLQPSRQYPLLWSVES